MKKLLKYLGVIVPFFAAMGIQYAVVIIISVLYGIVVTLKIILARGTTDGTEFSRAFEDALSRDTLYLISVIAILACGIVFFFWYRILIRGEIRGTLRKVITVKNVLMFILLGIGCQFFVRGVMSLVEPFFIEVFTDYGNTMNEIMSGSKIVVFFFTVLLAPISEELIFRGVILHKSSKVLPFLGANLLQALLFGIYHGNIVQGIYATLTGFLLGFIYYKFRTIFAPILLHILINASAYIVIYIPANTLSYSIVVIISGVLIIIPLLIIKPEGKVIGR